MTVSTTTNRVGYTGDAVTTVFAFPYKFIAAADLVVYVAGVQLLTGFTVGTPSDSGANVTFTTAPANGAAIIILANPAQLQSTSLPSTGPFPAKAVETALDKLTLLIQRVSELATRSFRLSDSDTSGASTILPTPSSNKIIGWNQAANGLQNIDPTTLATIVAFGTANADVFTGTGAQTVFTLSANPGAQANLDVAVGGVTQLPNTDYTWGGGTTVTFAVAPPNGVKVLVRYFQGLPQGVTDSAASTFVSAGTGAVSRPVQEKLREGVSVKDFGALGNNVADDTTKQQAAITYVQSTYDPAVYGSNSPANGPCSLFYPAGYFKTSGVLNLTKKVAFKGDGPAEFSSGSRVAQFTASTDLFLMTPIAQGSSLSFQDMTLLSNASGSGHLIHVVRGAGGANCNSQRYMGMVFGTPQGDSLFIEAGDDILVDAPLFDVSATGAVQLGTTAALDLVINARFRNPIFFSVAARCFLINNVAGLTVTDPHVYSNAAARTTYFMDAHTLTPYQVRNVSIIGGTFGLNTLGGGNTSGVDCLFKGANVVGLTIANGVGTNCGAGVGSALSFVELTGTCSNVNIVGNYWSGAFDTKNFYNDSAAGGLVLGANISGNHFKATAGAGQALVCGNTYGVIANNTFEGFTSPSVSEKVFTTGNAVNPGSITTLGSYLKTFTVTGARQGDRVEVGVSSTTWMVPVGIEIVAYISALNTVTVEYRNLTAGTIGVGAHDITYMVVRGA